MNVASVADRRGAVLDALSAMLIAAGRDPWRDDPPDRFLVLATRVRRAVAAA